MRRKRFASAMGILAAASARVVSAQSIPPIIYDQFTYAAGSSLDHQGFWTQIVSGGITTNNQNLSYTGLNPSATGAASLDNSASGTNGEKMQTNYVGQAAASYGSIYFSLALRVDSLSALTTNTDGAFFTGFNNVHTSNGLTNGAMFVRIRQDAVNTGSFDLGVEKGAGGGASISWGGAQAVNGQTMLLVGKFNAVSGTNSAQIWVNPDPSKFGLSEASEPTSDVTAPNTVNIDADDFFLRRTNNSAAMTVDDVRIGNTWASVAPLVWSDGGGDNIWANSSNWYTGTTPNAIGVTPSFLDVAGVSRTVNVASNHTVGGLIFNSATGYSLTNGGGALTMQTQDSNVRIDSLKGNQSIAAPITLNNNLLATIVADSVTLSGNVGGNASITKVGAGTLILGGVNSYSGSTVINTGTLESVGPIPGAATAGSISIAAGAALTVHAGGAGQNADADMNTLVTNAAFAAGGKLAVNVDSNNTSTVSANITQALSLYKTGPGLLTLAGNNSYTGNTTISAGTLRVTNDASLGAVPGGPSDNITLDGGTLQLGAGTGINANRIIDITANGGTISSDASQTNSYGSSFAFRLPLGAGTGGPLTKVGGGTFNYQGGYQGSYSALNVLAGTFQIGKADELPSGAITLNGGALRVLQGFSAGNSLSVGASNGTFDTSSNDVTLGGSITGTGTLHKTGGSRLINNGVQLGGLSVDQGAVFTTPGRSAAKLSKLGSLTVASGASMDVYDNDLIIDYAGASPDPSQLSATQALIKRGFANGAWTGDGLTSSQAQNLAGSVHQTALGFAEASNVSSAIGGSFDGASLDNSMVLVRYTYSGDANLDGTVNSSDFDLLAANFGATGKSWNDGDYNYDGIVNTLDFNALATNYGQVESAPLPDAALGAVVPEPTTIGLIGSAAAMLVSRRRRSN